MRWDSRADGVETYDTGQQMHGRTVGDSTMGDHPNGQRVESSIPVKYNGNGIQTSSTEDDGFLSFLGPTWLAIACACILAVLLICLGAFLWMRNRRRRLKLLKELTFNGCEEGKITKSAPNSRYGSPKPSKRMSCPNAFTGAPNSKTGTVLVKSLTCDPILDSTLPPECVQPKTSDESNAHSGFYQHCPDDSDLNHPETAHGRIWFSTFYDVSMGRLNVNLIKVQNLPKRDVTNEEPDPFVKIYLLPDDKLCQVSKSKKNTQSPVFNELHSFQVAPLEVKDRNLRFSVYDVDKRRVRHSLGHIVINLNDLDLDRGQLMCSELERTVQSSSSLGDLQLSLAYIPAKEKVKIGVHKARKLQLDKSYLEKGAYVRAQLFYGHKCHRTKRTVTRPIMEDCFFDESLAFTIQGRQLESCSLVVTIMITHPHDFSKNDSEYGRVVIGPFMYARGEELLHWQQMVAQPKHVTTRWHTLVNTTP